jgi:hypothetical protein
VGDEWSPAIPFVREPSTPGYVIHPSSPITVFGRQVELEVELQAEATLMACLVAEFWTTVSSRRFRGPSCGTDKNAHINTCITTRKLIYSHQNTRGFDMAREETLDDEQNEGSERRVTLSITVHRQLKERLERLAARENNTVSRIVERLCQASLDGDDR